VASVAAAATAAAAGSQMITLLKMALEYDNHHDRQDTVSSRSDVSQITSSSWVHESHLYLDYVLYKSSHSPTNSTSKTQQVAWQRRMCVYYILSLHDTLNLQLLQIPVTGAEILAAAIAIVVSFMEEY
jgi:hypothetical protein